MKISSLTDLIHMAGDGEDISASLTKTPIFNDNCLYLGTKCQIEFFLFEKVVVTTSDNRLTVPPPPQLENLLSECKVEFFDAPRLPHPYVEPLRCDPEGVEPDFVVPRGESL